jgi:Tfp pilus assembly protein PilN
VAVLGALAVGAVLVLWFLQGVRLNDLDDQVAQQEAVNASLQQQVDTLQRFADQKASLDQQKTLLKSALVNTVRWSGVLNDLSQMEPNTMWLSSMAGSVATPTAAVPGETPVPGTVPGTPTNLIGTIQFQGNALDTDTISMWLTKLEGVKGWVNPWLAGAQEADMNGTPVWTFNSSVDLDTHAARKGGTP